MEVHSKEQSTGLALLRARLAAAEEERADWRRRCEEQVRPGPPQLRAGSLSLCLSVSLCLSFTHWHSGSPERSVSLSLPFNPLSMLPLPPPLHSTPQNSPFFVLYSGSSLSSSLSSRPCFTSNSISIGRYAKSRVEHEPLLCQKVPSSLVLLWPLADSRGSLRDWVAVACG